jgi:hypothetical protein
MTGSFCVECDGKDQHVRLNVTLSERADSVKREERTFSLMHKKTFLRRMVHNTVANSHTEIPLSFVCPRIIMEYIHNYFPHLVPPSSAQMGAKQSHPSPSIGESRGESEELNMWPNSKGVISL